MVKIHLSRLMGEKKINQSDLARKTGIRPNTINELYHEINVSIKIDHIDSICKTLNCSVGELMEYIPNEMK